jgi:hypothetical protein
VSGFLAGLPLDHAGLDELQQLHDVGLFVDATPSLVRFHAVTESLRALSNDECINTQRVATPGLSLFLKSPAGHFPKLKTDGSAVLGGCRLVDSGELHLDHSSAEFASVIKFSTDILGDLSCRFRERVLSGYHVVDGGLDVSALPFKPGFPIPTVAVLVAALLAPSGVGIAALADAGSRHGGGLLLLGLLDICL